jgi:hypothetical protein
LDYIFDHQKPGYVSGADEYGSATLVEGPQSLSGQLLADFLGFSLSIDRLVASLVRRGDQSTAAGGEESGKLVLLAAERSDEQAAGLAASLWSGRAPGTTAATKIPRLRKSVRLILNIFDETAALFMMNKV